MNTLLNRAVHHEPRRAGKAHHLPPLDEAPLRDAQVAAIRGIERALAEQRYSRSLVQMATGAGKTYAAVTEAYRLLKWGGFSKVLFLVDRNNLQEITPGGSVRKSTSRRGPSRARSWRESRAGTDRSRVVGTVGDRRM